MQKEKLSRKTLTQDVKIRTDARTDRRTDGKTKAIYPLTYFVCRGYNKVDFLSQMERTDILSYFSTKTYVGGTYKKHFNEGALNEYPTTYMYKVMEKILWGNFHLSGAIIFQLKIMFTWTHMLWRQENKTMSSVFDCQ